jgi:hypothetical protein
MTRTHNPLHSITLHSNSDALALLHDTAHIEATRLRREAINEFWHQLGQGIIRIGGTRTSRDGRGTTCAEEALAGCQR